MCAKDRIVEFRNNYNVVATPNMNAVIRSTCSSVIYMAVPIDTYLWIKLLFEYLPEHLYLRKGAGFMVLFT